MSMDKVEQETPPSRLTSTDDLSRRPDRFNVARRPTDRGRTAVWQARLVLLVMINIAQLWILSATIEAALAGEYKQLIPLIAASAFCWVIALTIFLWWKPVSSRGTSTGYVARK